MLLIGSKCRSVSIRKSLIYRAVLECTERCDLPVGIVGNDFQTIENQRLSHDIEVGAQRIHDSYASLFRECGEAGIVGTLGKRVVHRLHETVRHKEVGNIVPRCLRIRVRSRAH